MKKLMPLLLVAISFGAYAQMELTPLGLKYTNDNKDYNVITFKGKSSKEIFDLINKYFISSTNNEFEIQNKIDGEILSITSTVKNAIFFKQLGISTMSYNMTYNWTFEFKDERLKVSTPVITRMHNKENSGYNRDLYLFISKDLKTEKPSSQFCVGCVMYIFKDNGKIKLENASNSIESFFNKKLSEISKIESRKVSDW